MTVNLNEQLRRPESPGIGDNRGRIMYEPPPYLHPVFADIHRGRGPFDELDDQLRPLHELEQIIMADRNRLGMHLMPPDLRPRLDINQGPDGQEAQNFGFGEGMGMLGE